MEPGASLMGTTSVVAGLVLRWRQALLTAIGLGMWQGWWDFGPPHRDVLTGYLLVLLSAAGAVLAGRFVSRSLVLSSVQ